MRKAVRVKAGESRFLFCREGIYFIYRKMEKILKKIQFNIVLEEMRRVMKVAESIDFKKARKNILVGLVIFTWLFAGFGFYINYKIEKTDINIAIQSHTRTPFENKIREMLSGFPMQKMSRYISGQNKETAAFLVAIGKKESNWGKRKPVLNGKDCFNYWGYRGKREKMGSGGHTCFDSPKDAVFSVANRIDELVFEYNLNTPEKMIIWKCGSTCKEHSQSGVDKWIADVDLYYNKLIEE